MAQMAINISFDIDLQDVVVFIVSECFILLREASRHFELQKRNFDRIRLLSIFWKINRYSAKHSMQ